MVRAAVLTLFNLGGCVAADTRHIICRHFDIELSTANGRIPENGFHLDRSNSMTLPHVVLGGARPARQKTTEVILDPRGKLARQGQAIRHPCSVSCGHVDRSKQLFADDAGATWCAQGARARPLTGFGDSPRLLLLSSGSPSARETLLPRVLALAHELLWARVVLLRPRVSFFRDEMVAGEPALTLGGNEDWPSI